jgi:hypothetical protein
LIADATSKATSPANHAVSPRLRAHSTLERPLSATCLCGRFWPGVSAAIAGTQRVYRYGTSERSMNLGMQHSAGVA